MLVTTTVAIFIAFKVYTLMLKPAISNHLKCATCLLFCPIPHCFVYRSIYVSFLYLGIFICLIVARHGLAGWLATTLKLSYKLPRGVLLLMHARSSHDAENFHHNCRREVTEQHRQHHDAQGAAEDHAEDAVELGQEFRANKLCLK